MASEQHRRTVGDYVTLQRGTTYKGSLVGEPGPALLGLGSIEIGGGFRHGRYKSYGGDCPANLMLFPGDLYVALKGATKDGKMIGSVARVPRTVSSGRLTQDTVKLVFRNPHPDDASYLYWILRTPQYRAYCAGHAMGSAVVALSRRDFLNYPVSPLTSTRKQLVALLEALDDKIDFNRRINETLEAMARALFESWFVNFDPVRAKAEGRDPGLPKPIADLFPKGFHDSELGEIPAGWRVRRLDDLTTHLRRGISPSYIENGGVRVLNQRCVRGGEIDTSNARRHDTRKRSIEGQRLQAGDVLINSTGVGTLGRVAQLVIFEEEVIVDSHVTVVRADGREVSWLYLGIELRRREEEIETLGEGSTGQTELSRTRLGSLQVIVPPRSVLTAFDKVILPFRERAAKNSEQLILLAGQRDTLLPKLVSGEIRVRDGGRSLETTK